MPYSVPVENVIAACQAIKHTDMARTMIADYEGSEDDITVELPDYEHLDKPLIEVFTLDAATCAACTYKYTIREDVARTKKMGVQKLPSIYINGELKWSSIIPSKQELFDELKKHM